MTTGPNRMPDRSNGGHVPVSAAADPLSDVLDTVRLRGALFFLWEASWPFCSYVPPARDFAPLILPAAEALISYHVVVEGPCWGALAGEAPVRLETGDVLLVPHGDAYWLSSAPESQVPEDPGPALEFFRRMAGGAPARVSEGGGGPERNRVICGFLGCDVRPFNPVLAALPRLVRLHAQYELPDPLTYLVNFALVEAGGGRRGGRCVLLRLSELIFVEAVRRHLESAPGGAAGWLGALRDPAVGRALGLLHGDPAAPWTVESLARAAGASRSTLAVRFAETVGRTPMHYLACWRMQLAARRLAEGGEKVYAVAREVGYESEAAFSRAFKRIVGVAPVDWRRTAADEA